MKLLLASRDADYVAMLMRAARESDYKDKISVSIATNLEEYLISERLAQYDVVVADEDIYKKARKTKGIPEVQWLVWSDIEQAGRSSDSDHVKRLYKYQPVGMMLGEVLAEYRRNDMDPSSGVATTEHCRMVAVYSAAGGGGVSTVAQGLAELLAMSGYKTFYLNMEKVPGVRKPAVQQSDEKFGAILYQLRSGVPQTISRLWRRDPDRLFTSLPLSEHYNEWLEYDQDDIGKLLDTIEKDGSFEIAIMDLDHDLSRQTLAAIDHCRVVLWLERPDPIANRKTEFVRKSLVKQFGEQINSKLTFAPSPAIHDSVTHSSYVPYMKLLGLEVKQSLE